MNAPLDRLFALSTRVELVKATLGMNLVGGVTHGAVQEGSRVAWKGWKFGLPTEHHTLITGFAAPHTVSAQPGGALPLHAEEAGERVAWFQDSQERGRFQFFQHDHWLRERIGADGRTVTVLEDEVHFSLPFGVLGRIASRWILTPYIEALVKRRFASLKQTAEGEGWRQWI